MAASTKNPFEVADFSGGITDNVFSGVATTSFALDNFFITPDRKLLTRPGSALDDAQYSPIPLGNSRIGSLINYARNDTLLSQSANQIFYRPNRTSGPWSTLHGPTGNPALNVGTTANYISKAEWNKQVLIVNDAFSDPVKIYKDENGVFQLRSVGLPALGSEPVITIGTTSDHSYIYAFIYSCEYKVLTQSYIELGPAQWVTVDKSSAPDVSPNQITNIPVLTNAGGKNYDLAGVKVDIYRTINNGTNFYKVGSVSNGTASFTDSVSDDTLQTNLQLYTNDGTLDYLPAPKAKFVHVVGNVGFYAYTKDSTGEHPFRIHQSVPGNPGFVPEITWLEVEEEITGLHSVREMPILLGKRIIFRIDNRFQASGQGGMTATKIHHSAGCISNSSCVEAENWLFWAGNDGFYGSDGYNVLKISDHLNDRYRAMLRATPNTSRIQGCFDEANRRVYWTVGQSPSNTECDSLFALDLRYGITTNSTFTTVGGNSFRPTAIEIFDGLLHRADNLGFVYRHDPGLTTDPKVQPAVAANQWPEETIIWNLTSNQFNFGSTFMRKFISRVLIQAGNVGNTTIQITAINDQGKKVRPLKIIRWRRNVSWGDDTFTWGNSDCVWDSTGLIEQWRRFPAGGLRVSYLQLIITNGLGIVSASKSEGPLVLNRTSRTAVLSGKWPKKAVDYQLRLSHDNYFRSYPVQAINGSFDTITVLDPQGMLPLNGTYDWELWGYEKGEPLNLLGYNLHWDNVDQNQRTFHGGDDGANS